MVETETIGIMDQIHVINTEDGITEAYVPLSLIFTEDVGVDQNHVRRLAGLMQKEAANGIRTGQLIPALLAYMPKSPQFRICDGYHRIAAQRLNELDEVRARIKPVSGWEEIIDLRIIAAASHKSVGFARIVAWVGEAWQLAPWSDRLTIYQAFNISRDSTVIMPGVNLGLNPEQATAIKWWVKEKCNQWDISPALTYDYLLTAQHAAPDLVRTVRPRRSGSTLEALTPQHLKAITSFLPNLHDRQRLVATVAIERGLRVRSTRALALAVKAAASDEEIRDIIREERWKLLETTDSVAAYVAPRPTIEKKIPVDTQSLKALLSAEIRIAELTIENAVLAGRYNPTRVAASQGQKPDKPSQKQVAQEAVKVPEETLPRMVVDDEKIADVVTRIYNTKQRVFNFLKNKFGIHPDEAEDILQEVIIKTLTTMRRGTFEFRGQAMLDHWTLVVARNVTISKYRREMRLKITEINERESDTQDVEEGSTAMKQEDYHTLIQQALPFLNEEQRRVFILKEFFPLSYSDIAQILNISATNARVNAFRAREKFATLIVEGKIT